MISNVNVTGTPPTATVAWDTDDASDSAVMYGTSPGVLDQQVTDAALVTSHSIDLPGLVGATSYYYKVSSCNLDSLCSTSTVASFSLPGQASFTTIDDATVESATPDTNFGSDATVAVDLTPLKKSYLKFTVAGTSGQITSATLKPQPWPAATPDVLRTDGLHPGRHGQGVIHPGHLPAQLPVGPRPPAGPGEPGAAGPGLGRWGRTRRSIRETYGLAKEGARHHGCTGKRGYHPLLAIAAGTGDVLMSRLREGRANTARGAAHFLRDHAGANGRLTLRADSGFYTHGVVSVCRKMDVRFSITIRQPCTIHRGDTRRCLDADSLLDRRRRCGRDHLHSLPE